MFREPHGVKNDPRRRVGAQVHALATAVTNSSECSRLYGVNSTTKLVNCRVLEVIVGKTATGRSSTSLKVLWKLVEAEGGRENTPTIKIGNVKCGRVPSVSSAVNIARVQSSSSALPHQGPIPVRYTAG